VNPKLKIGAAVVVGGAIAYYLWKRRGSLVRPTCGAGYAWHVATPTELSQITRYSLPMQEQLKKFGGYCAAKGTVSEPEVVDSGPILYPWQVM
jgi:hypothetical protein